MQKKHDDFNLRRKVKEMCYLRKTNTANAIEDENNNYIGEKGKD